MARVQRGDSGYRVNSTRGLGAFDHIEADTFYGAIRRGLEQGLSDNKVAEYAGVCTKTVLRYRQRHNIGIYTERG